MFLSKKLVPLLCIPLLFLIGVGCASVPIYQPLTQRTKRTFGLANAFSGGVFLGAALLHLLPDADESLSEVHHIGEYPLSNLICMLGFIATLCLESVLSPGHEALITAGDVFEVAKDARKPSMLGDPLSRPKQQPPKLSSALRRGNPYSSNDGAQPLLFRVDSPRLGRGWAQRYRVEDEMLDFSDDDKAYRELSDPLPGSGLSRSFNELPQSQRMNADPPSLRLSQQQNVIEPVRTQADDLFVAAHKHDAQSDPQFRVRSETVQVLHSDINKEGSLNRVIRSNNKNNNNKSKNKRRRRATLDPSQPVRIRYRSRMFESGFRSAMMIAKEMGYDLFDDCNVVFEAQFLDQGIQQGRKVTMTQQPNKADQKRRMGLVLNDDEDYNHDNTLEELSLKNHNNNHNPISNNPSAMSALMFLFILSIHSLITGMALGSSDDRRMDQIIVAVALIVHKACASLALGIAVKKAHWSISFSMRLLTGFAVSTPMGVAIGLALASATKGQFHDIMVACFSAFSSGTFLYLSLMENIVEEFVESQTDLISKWWAVLTGALVMAVLATFG